MAISTMYAFLMYKSSGTTYTKLVDIKSFPDLGSTPSLLDTTTLSQASKTGINGIVETDTLEFECNYTATDYDTVKAACGTEKDFAIWLGANASGTPDGHNGKFEFKGTASVYVTGGGVNEVVGMKVAIAASTEITKASAT